METCKSTLGSIVLLLREGNIIIIYKHFNKYYYMKTCSKKDEKDLYVIREGLLEMKCPLKNKGKKKPETT